MPEWKKLIYSSHKFVADAKTVLLIDEIDKADTDFQDDMLDVLDQMSFDIIGIDKTVKAKNRPVVVITSNAKKDLSDPFLGRCNFHHIAFPGCDMMRRILAVHFPAVQLRILDYNRLVRDLGGLGLESFLDRIRAEGFGVSERHDGRKPEAPGSFGMFVDGRWFLLRARPEIVPSHDPVRRLDVSVLADRLLGPVLGIGDPRTDKRIDFVGGIRGMDELQPRVRSGEHADAFAMFPTRIEDVMDVADAGLVMPPKSTWFEPKLRSGMVVHLFEE